ncbi:MAG: hypothetical protein M1817_002291 [Caeruleum heppii]|nr:MAG: hypothetical protein M1817_002291 [Caeruleum heppii]
MMVAATYQLSIFCLKTSILLLYMRIFSTSKSLRYISWSTIVFIFVFYIVGFFMTILACRPQRKIWDPMVEGTCHRWAAGQVVAAAINIATDVLVLVLPLRQVWKLQLPRKQKWGLSAIFAVGSFACVTTIIRLDLAVHVLRNPNPDFTWEGTKPAVWGAIELNLGICCACAPMLKPFLRHHFPRIFTATRHTPSASAPSTFASKISSPHSVSPASSSSPPFGRRTEDRKFAEGSVVADSDLSSIERGTFLQLQEKGADGDVRYGSGGSYGQR